MIQSYNHEPNRGILNKKPIDLYLETNWEKIKKHSLESINTGFPRQQKLLRIKFQPGEVVRLSLTKNKFFRSFHIQNSPQLFIIKKVNLNHLPITYNLKTIDDEEIKGIFYEQQLIKTVHDGYFSIKVIRRRKKNTKFLINYLDYPTKPPVWVKKQDLKKTSGKTTSKN